jgi:ribonuclease HIII
MVQQKDQNSQTNKPRTHYTIEFNDAQMSKLKSYCERHLWENFTVNYARFAFKNKPSKVNAVAYESGKVVISGKGTEDFVMHVIEAEITGDPRLGYDEIHHPEWFKPHAGLDEAGKGDLFGPLVCATVIADTDHIREWMDNGLRESKKVADTKLFQLEKKIRGTQGVVIKTAFCSMEKYNQLMSKPNANLNKLTGWLHARALTDALKQKWVPDGLLDQFSKEPIVQNYLKQSNFNLRMQTKAEADPVVAAASIIARATFIREIQKLSELCGIELLKGASSKVKEQGKTLVEKIGSENFGHFAKLHFKTSYEILGLPLPQKKVYSRYSKS